MGTQGHREWSCKLADDRSHFEEALSQPCTTLQNVSVADETMGEVSHEMTISMALLGSVMAVEEGQ